MVTELYPARVKRYFFIRQPPTANRQPQTANRKPKVALIIRVLAWAVLLPGVASVLWSTLGVVDDGRTDNTAALNALPVNTFIEGDCPRGGVVLVQGVWNLRSN